MLISGSLIIKAGTHVDDFIFTTNNCQEFEAWFAEVRKELNISSMNRMGMNGVDYMSLWITVNSARNYLKISQKGYIEQQLRRLGLDRMRSSSTPMASGVKFFSSDMPAEVDVRRRDIYRRLIGVARWITRNACPEANFAVSYLSCFLVNPSAAMLKAVVQVFRYFKWTVENDVEGRCFRAPPAGGVIPLGFKLKVGKNQAYAYIDSTYLSEEKSLCRYGVVIFVNMCCVFELSRRLMDWVLSSTEAEFCALACGAQECLYIRYVLEAINEPQNGPLLIGQDNKSCIQIAENPGRHHGRTKHIDVRYRWIECKIYHAKIALVYVNTKHMVADSQTKALCYEAHATMASAMKGQKFPEKQKKEHKKRKLDEDDEVTINWVLPENQACQRADCPCTSRCVVINADGSVRRRHPYCCRTCARGRPCARNYHPTPIVVNEHDERVGTEET